MNANVKSTVKVFEVFAFTTRAHRTTTGHSATCAKQRGYPSTAYPLSDFAGAVAQDAQWLALGTLSHNPAVVWLLGSTDAVAWL